MTATFGCGPSPQHGDAMDTGGGSGEASDSTGSDDGWQSPPREVVLDNDEMCPGLARDVRIDTDDNPWGIVPLEAAARISGTHVASFTWLAESGSIRTELPTDPGEVTVSYALRESETATFVESAWCRMTSCPITCASRLEVGFDVHLRTRDGGLDEKWVVQVGILRNGTVLFERTLNLDDTLGGSLRSEQVHLDAGWSLLEYDLQTELDVRLGHRGRVMARVVDPDGQLWLSVFGVWPLPM